MGNRTQVEIVDEGVYLYSHWLSGKIEQIVKNALAKRWRWNDPEYLARIIFDEMLLSRSCEETGFGIGTSMHGDLDNLIKISCKAQTVSVCDNEGKVLREKSFDAFIREEIDE